LVIPNFDNSSLMVLSPRYRRPLIATLARDNVFCCNERVARESLESLVFLHGLCPMSTQVSYQLHLACERVSVAVEP
jgi:hypothetical protein